MIKRYFALMYFIILLAGYIHIERCAPTYTEGELRREQQKWDCLHKLTVVDEKTVTEKYEIIGVISNDFNNFLNSMSEDEIVNWYKEQACKNWWKPDAIFYPKVERGPVHTTYTSKAIRWKKMDNEETIKAK